MKRHGCLFGRIISFENLLNAARKAQRGKKRKDSTARFNLDIENELLKLQAELKNKNYRVGAYKHFMVYDPKKRLISALPYRDRVVQHALCNIVEPVWEKSFIHDTYACLKNKGSHRAVNRFTEYCRRNKYVLKCDVKSYFASIDHAVLFETIKKKIKDPEALWLIKLIIDSTPSPGISIGNLASQIFANLYLNELDHYLKETVKCRYYLRYMDDLIVFGGDKNRLSDVKRIVDVRLKNLKLRLHPNKSRVYLTAEGVSFLGYKIYPTHRLVIRPNIARERRRLKKYLAKLKTGLMDWGEMIRSIRSWFGYAIHADSYNLRKRLLAEFDLLYEG